jgi:hypothetical protein
MRRKVILLGEGPEEKDYLDALNKMGALNPKYSFIPESARGICNIANFYQSFYSDQSIYLTLVYCDTEKGNPNYQKQKDGINKLFGFDAASRIVFFVSPCTMLVTLNHFTSCPTPITGVGKKKNGELLQAAGVSFPNPPYDAREEQRRAINSQLSKANFRKMKENIVPFVGSDKKTPATNALVLFQGISYDSTFDLVENTAHWLEEEKNKIED